MWLSWDSNLRPGPTVRRATGCAMEPGSGTSKTDLKLVHFLHTVDSLSRPRLSRITAYLEMKFWSQPKQENLTTGKKCCGKEEKFLLSTIFSIYRPITYIFVKCGCSNYFFLNSANLICRGTDISQYFIESIGFRDNESRLYFSAIICKR